MCFLLFTALSETNSTFQRKFYAHIFSTIKSPVLCALYIDNTLQAVGTGASGAYRNRAGSWYAGENYGFALKGTGTNYATYCLWSAVLAHASRFAMTTNGSHVSL